MGLNERRKIKELSETTFPERVREIEEICGAPIPYEVDWDSFADDAEALNFLDNLACHRINMALRTICTDDMGKEAVRDALKNVALRNVKDKGERRMSFEDGTLSLQTAWALRTDAYFSDSEIRQELMKKL